LCKKTQKCVTRQQRMGEQSRISVWPDGNVLMSIYRSNFFIPKFLSKNRGVFCTQMHLSHVLCFHHISQ